MSVGEPAIDLGTGRCRAMLLASIIMKLIAQQGILGMKQSASIKPSLGELKALDYWFANHFRAECSDLGWNASWLLRQVQKLKNDRRRGFRIEL
jgi:hypothetical protein